MFKSILLVNLFGLRVTLNVSFFNLKKTPYDCGAADKYYGRRMEPHYFNWRGNKVYACTMTQKEIADYLEGYADELGEKDWGDIPKCCDED